MAMTGAGFKMKASKKAIIGEQQLAEQTYQHRLGHDDDAQDIVDGQGQSETHLCHEQAKRHDHRLENDCWIHIPPEYVSCE